MATQSPSPRIPLNTFGIGLGLVGLAGGWTIASSNLGLQTNIPDIFWLVAAIAWVWLIGAHFVRGRHADERLWTQLHHPIQAPFASLVPIVAMLLGARLHRYVPAAGTVVVVLAVAMATFLAGLLIVRFARKDIPHESIHGGYLIPTVSASLVAAISAAQIGMPTLSIVCLVVGGAFWIAMFAVLLIRLKALGPLPTQLTATMAVVASPPAVASEAWIVLNGDTWDPLATALLIATGLLLLMQLGYARKYRALPFSLGFWSFTFPLAAVSSQTMEWLDLVKPIGWQLYTTAAIAVLTIVVLTIAGRSLRIALVAHDKKVAATAVALMPAGRAFVSNAHPDEHPACA